MRGAFLAVSLMAALAACKPRGTTQPHNPAVWGEPGTGAGSRIEIQRSEAPVGPASPVLELLAGEVARNLGQLQSEEREVPAYFLAYDLVARDHLWLEVQQGEVVRRSMDRDRTVDIDVRVGSPQLDNSHSQGGNYGPGNGLGLGRGVSVQDDPLALAQALWLLTEEQYRDALVALSSAESGEQLRSQDEAKPTSPDFSEEKAVVHLEPRVQLDLEGLRQAWEPRLREVSLALSDDDRVLESTVVLLINVDNRSFVDSGGSKIQAGHVRLRIMLSATAQADDGMRLSRMENFEVHTPEQLPAQALLLATAKRLREELLALRVAPIAEPYTGPAVLAGPAAGVFFHEIFGHRLEGHRQKDDYEGQTFTKMLGKAILPEFIDVYDDPTLASIDGTPLNGHYFVDDEATPAQRATLVTGGVLESFLMSRSVVAPFTASNGHGRRERGHKVVARQGNLIVSGRETIPEAALRKALIAEVQRQSKPYGLWFADISGGYTITDRSGPQAFKVEPLMVYRIWTDGRPDELVRGADIVGTPLAAFETIMAAGDEPGIFNGTCGAESGWVPVSAVSPSLLLRSLEIERSSHSRDKPPLMPPPVSSGRAPEVKP